MAVLGFVLRRIRAAPGRWLPGALGIGAAFAGFVVALIAPAMAGDVALRSELRNLPVADRLVTLVAIARQPVGDTAVDPFVRAQLRRRGFDDPVRLTMLRQLAAPAGTVFRLAGVDQLGGGVELIDGRLPTHCDVDDCEAVIWARDTAPTSITLDPALHLHVVGTVRRVDDRVMAGTFEPHPHEVVILVDGADSPDRITALELIQRSTGWVTAVDPDHLAVDDIPGVLGNLAGLGRSNEVANLAVTGPDAALRSIYDRARITTNRLALPVGQAGTLLGGFAVITTLAIRPWHRRGLRVLRLWSASRSDERRFSAFEAATIVGIGAAIGAIIAVIATMIIARIADLDAATAIGRLADRGRALAVIAMLVGYWAIAVAILATAFERARLKRRVMVSDVIGLASVGIWALAATRGSSGASSLARGGDPLLAVTPALACIVAACVAIRIVPPSYSLIRRLLPQRWWAARLGMVDAVGRTPRALATGAFVAGAMTLATFALGYRSTLQAGSFDQAAYAVPLDFTLSEGQALI